MVKNPDAEKLGMSISLFRKLTEQHRSDAVILKSQYRMNDNICFLINKIAYVKLIKQGSPAVKDAMLTFSD